MRAFVGVARSGSTARFIAEADDLAVMRRIDELHLELCSGVARGE